MGKTQRCISTRYEERYKSVIPRHRIDAGTQVPYTPRVANRRGNKYSRGYPAPAVGTRFSFWVVTGDEFKIGVERRIPVRCVCGNEASIRVDKLWVGKASSCLPCKQSLAGQKGGNPNGNGDILGDPRLRARWKTCYYNIRKRCLNPWTKTLKGMVVAEFPAPSNPLENFWNILLRLMGLTSLASPWTELITTEVMNPETYEWYLRRLTTRTVETFDILEAGPNNCFQIDGAIVHNCGYGMGDKKFQATCQSFGQEISIELAQLAVQTYRERHWPVPLLWSNLQRAAIAAVDNVGTTYSVNYTSWYVSNGFLWCKLPSGRRLAYAQPTVEWLPPPWGGEPVRSLCHWGINSYSRKWEKQRTYGGKLTENAIQAISRDLMADAMLRIDGTGIWDIVLSVHDELIAERDADKGSNEGFCSLMAMTPRWAEGCPIKVEGWAGTRYKK